MRRSDVMQRWRRRTCARSLSRGIKFFFPNAITHAMDWTIYHVIWYKHIHILLSPRRIGRIFAYHWNSVSEIARDPSIYNKAFLPAFASYEETFDRALCATPPNSLHALIGRIFVGKHTIARTFSTNELNFESRSNILKCAQQSLPNWFLRRGLTNNSWYKEEAATRAIIISFILERYMARMDTIKFEHDCHCDKSARSIRAARIPRI